MAFPTTQMAGYVGLKDRITFALSRCQEQSWLDFKESQPWQVLRWRLLKTIMGMANLRDGGLIVVGVAEKGTSWELTGIEPDHLAAFDYDEIVDQLWKYASPQVAVDIVVHDHEDGKRYLAFHVHQFKDSPVVCRINSPDDLKQRDRLAAADFYVRPTTGTPRTEKVTDAARMHDLFGTGG
jgi:predicted HTH transcriptional regulator